MYICVFHVLEKIFEGCLCQNAMIHTGYVKFAFYVDLEYNSLRFYVSKDLIHVFWCYREKSHHVSAFDTQSDTPSSTRSGTWSGTPSNTLSCTKMMGDLEVMVLATSDRRIRNMGFACACPL
jgi:hypothetical protein